MSDTTTEILNETTSVQSRIDTVLGTPELDWANDSGWHPGDPLHRHPYERYFLDGEGLSVCPRPMVQLVEEPEARMRCEPCQVSWRGPDGCWLCGEERPPLTWSDMIARDSAPLRPWRRASDAVTIDAAQATTRSQATVAEALADYQPRVVLGCDGSRDDTEPVNMTAAPGAVWLLPSVTDPAAPTLRELSEGHRIGTLTEPSPVENFASAAGFQLDDWQRYFLREWMSDVSALAGLFAEQWRFRPLPLPIDGHEYRRRSRRRRR